MQRDQIGTVVLTTLLVLSAVGAVTVPAAGEEVASTPGNPPEPTTENRPPSEGANFTVVPQDHSPGTTTTYTMLSKGEGPWGDSRGLETIGYYKITTQKTRFKDCNPNNARAFGIDRGNDASGTQTDTSLLSHMESYSVAGRIITVDIYDEGALGGTPTYLNRSDETVAQLAGCTVTPSEPGWYQFTGYVNGTNYQGNFQEVTLYSEYFYICDCESRQEAVDTLGPPPGEDGGNDGGGGGSTPTATATPSSGGNDGGGGSTPTATATPDSGGNDGGGGGSTQTATATPNSGGDDGGGSTPTAATNDTSTNGSSNATSANASANGTSANASSNTSNTSSNGSTGGTGGSGGSNASGPTTPTSSGSGPGFGLVAALGALAVALLAFRR